MKGLNKKIISKVLLFVLICQLFAVSALAAVDGSNVSYVCDYVDVSVDKTVLDNAYENANKITKIDMDEKEDFGKLITTQFVENKFDKNESAARANLANLLSKSMAVYFSTSAAELEKHLTEAEENVKDSFNAIFGENVDMQLWFDLFLRAKFEMQYLQAKNLRTWALGNRAELLPVMDSVHSRAISSMFEENAYESLRKIFEEDFKWNVVDFVAAIREMADIADTGNMAEYALLKAAARSAIELEINGVGDAELENAGKGIDIEKTTKLYTPSTVPAPQTARVIMYLDRGYNVSNVVDVHTKDPNNVVDIDKNEDNENITITYTGKTGTADIVFTRVPFTDSEDINPMDADWILRYRVVVEETVDKVEKPVWGDTADTKGFILWKAVDNATGYKVSLYKDGKLIKAVNDVTDTSCDLNEYITTVGSYTATVTAYSDSNAGEASEASDPYVVKGPAKPENVKWTDAVLSWDASESAESYIVKIHDKSNSEVLKTYTDVTDCTVDATEFLKDKFGTFYATVEAVDNHKIKSEAAKSDDYITYAVVKGNVKLESYIGNKKDSSGIKVTFGGVSTETDANGDFVLERVLPNTTGTLKIEHRWYLTYSKSFTCNAKELLFNNNESLVLLYGDSDDMYGVGALDIADIISRFDKDESQVEYDEAADCHHENNESKGVIHLEEINTAIRNAGKVTETAY